MTRPVGFALAVLLASGSGALAAPATPGEAARLTALFARYFGAPAGAAPASVTVTPHGEGYTAKVDLSRVFGFLAAAGVAVTGEPIIIELTPQADGRWRVEHGGLPLTGVANEQNSFSFGQTGTHFDGIFDPAFGGFASGTVTGGGATFEWRGPAGLRQGRLTQTGTTTTTGTAAGEGAADILTTTSAKNLALDVTLTPPPRADGTAAASSVVAIQAASFESHQSGKGLRLLALEDLWAYLVAHPSRASLAADQPAFKDKLRALLPFAAAQSGDAALRGLSVRTDFGTFSLDELSGHTASATSPSQGPSAGLRLAGFGLPAGLAPPWSAPLLPSEISLEESQSAVDMDAMLRKMIDAFDLTRPNPFDADAIKEASRAARAGSVITIAPSRIVTPTVTLTFEGEVRQTQPTPVVHLTVAATGLDKAVAAVRDAGSDDPTAGQVVNGFIGAKAFAKAEGVDRYSWVIDLAPDGALTVNGAPLGNPAAAPGGKKPLKL